jgi:hypothetical protein
MAAINFAKTISIREAVKLVIHCDTTTFLFRGPRGIGKSAMMAAFEKYWGDEYVYAYFDCAGKDVGDTGLPAIDHERRVSEWYVNTLFRMTEGKPVIIMLDEFAKAPLLTQTTLHTLLEERNKRMGSTPLPPGSRVFLTSNLTIEGLGDNLKAHTLDRVTEIELRPPTADEWVEDYAIPNNIEPAVIAFAKAYPQCFANFRDDPESYKLNPYVPQFGSVSSRGTTPRSMARASGIVVRREHVESDTLIAALSGTIGESAARDMEALIAYGDSIPTWEAITTNPKTTDVPDSPGACAVLVYGAVMKVEKDTISAFMEYLSRMEVEWQMVFGVSLAKHPTKQSVGFSSSAFSAWLTRNADLL